MPVNHFTVFKCFPKRRYNNNECRILLYKTLIILSKRFFYTKTRYHPSILSKTHLSNFGCWNKCCPRLKYLNQMYSHGHISVRLLVIWISFLALFILPIVQAISTNYKTAKIYSSTHNRGKETN